MLQILQHTPDWVFALLAGLILLGWQQSRDRTISLGRALLVPVIMMILSIMGLLATFGLTPQSISLWLAGLVVVSVLSYKLLPINGLHFDREIQRFFIPGSWLPLIIIMAIFFTKYSVAVIAARHGALLQQHNVVLGLCLLYGAYSGYFVSRAWGLLRCVSANPSRFV